MTSANNQENKKKKSSTAKSSNRTGSKHSRTKKTLSSSKRKNNKQNGQTLAAKTITQTKKPPKNNKNRAYLTRGQSLFGYLLTIVVSIFGAVIITLVAIPLALRVNPLTFYQGNFLKPNSKTIINATEKTTLVSAIAKKVKPSVVTITAVSKKSSNFLMPELFPDSEEEATGSGIIFRPDGYIITNNHVVENAYKVYVTFSNSSDVAGRVVSGDSESDIAVIKINKTNLPAAEIGSSKKLKVGDLAVAIGSPFRYRHSVTAGIISAKYRSLTDYESNSSKTLTDLIQTDAAINPGNSGGALANAKGQVIGINTAIATGGLARSSAGIGFAIPIEKAVKAAKELISQGKATHPYIGVSIRDSEKVALPNLPKGIFVYAVMSGGPAAKAGLKKGDVITKANGVRVKTAEDLITIIKRGAVGDKITVVYSRGGKSKSVDITLADKPQRYQP